MIDSLSAPWCNAAAAFQLPKVRVSAALSADGKLALVNVHPDCPARVGNLTTAAKGRKLTGAATAAHNTFEQPQATKPEPFGARPGLPGPVQT